MAEVREAVFQPILKVVKDVVERVQSNDVFLRDKNKNGAAPTVHVCADIA